MGKRLNGSTIGLGVLAATAALLITGPGLAGAAPERSADRAAKSAPPAVHFTQQIDRHSGKCLDVSGASTADGAAVIQWSCHGGANQQWLAVPLGNGFSLVIARHSGQCLDVRGASRARGAEVIQWPCHAGANQQWSKRNTRNGHFTLMARHSGQCLDLRDVSNRDGVSIVQNPCRGMSASQQWRIS